MSEQYLVSARKYRPTTFDTVVGQRHITTTLQNAIKNNQLGHAYLFCGPRGVGKTTCARILAKTVNCENRTPDIEACGTCNTCIHFNENNSMNVIELDAASNNSVDDIRLLNEQVRYLPQVGKYKVYIIDEVHMLSTSAFNAFLKTLEEPPAHAIFILATTEKHKILPTILSRCQIFDFKRIQTEDIVEHLLHICAKEDTKAEQSALHIIARKSEGCMRDALSIMDRIASFTNNELTYKNTLEHLNMLDEDLYFTITEHLLLQDYNAVLLLIDEILQKGFEGNVILNGLLEHFRNLLLCKDERMGKLLDISDFHKQQYLEKAAKIPESFILTAMRIINDAEIQYATAVNKRLHTELCFIKLANIANAINLAQLLQTEDVKKKLVNLKASLPKRAVKLEKTNTEDLSPPTTLKVDQTLEDKIDIEKKSKPETVSSSKKSAKKFGQNLLDELRDKTHLDQQSQKEIIALTDDLLQKTILEFIDNLGEGKDLLKTQIETAKFSIKDNNTIECLSYSYVQYNSMKNAQTDLCRFIEGKTNQKNIKLQYQLDEENINKDEKLVLTKNELFEQLLQQHPEFSILTDQLGMRIKASYHLNKDELDRLNDLKTARKKGSLTENTPNEDEVMDFEIDDNA